VLIRFDPLVREFDRMAAQLFSDARTPRAMPMDAYRREDELIVQFDLPGMDASSIDLTVEKNVLTVTAGRTPTHTESDELVVTERPYGVFSRQVFLGDGLDADRLQATYDNGVLRIEVPVLESAKPRRVPIAVASGEQQAITAGKDAA
jgi:HSP20 family protein